MDKIRKYSTIKQTFSTLFVLSNLDCPTLEVIARMAGVDTRVVEDMFTSVAIHRGDALKVLAAFSKYTGQQWTLDNVKVALLPTFEEICTTHQLDPASLSTGSGVPMALLDRMLMNHPVPEQEARLVLETVSRQSGHIYRLSDVDVKIEEVPHG